jgi:16S rRNA (guanine527-N7)-methyltransferase
MEKLGLEASTSQISVLLAYLQLLCKWNKAYNLTAVRDPMEMLNRHLVDSLSIAPWISGVRVLDVGTGAGLPGIPLAIIFPDKKFWLLDSNGKKTRFLTQCKIELDLDNIEVVNDRVESVQYDFKFDQIVSRAFSSLDNMVTLCGHLLADNGKFLAMKGMTPYQEMKLIPAGYQILETNTLAVPGCEAERHLLVVGREFNLDS